MLNYQIKKNEYLNNVLHSGVNRTPFIQSEDLTFDAPINLEEGYKQIVYPVRKEFVELEEVKDDQLPTNVEYKYIYTPFENSKVEFSTFINTPNRLECYSNFQINSLTQQTVKFELSTCGKVVIFVNGVKQVVFAPFTRNVNSMIEINLQLEIGTNDIVIYAVELAERDVFYYYQLKLLSDVVLEYTITPSINSCKYQEAISFLDSLYFIKDTYTTPILNFEYNNKLDLTNDYYFSLGEGFEIYYENSTDKHWIPICLNEKHVNLSGSPDFMSYVTFQAYVDGYVISKRFFVSKLEVKTPQLDNVSERMKYARSYIAQNGQTNINKSLIILEETKTYSSEVEAGIIQVLDIVESKGDCADFYIVPLMLIIKRHFDILPSDIQLRIDEAILNFRYWIDEPGSDVMWWFSENHALLFHIAQYIGGDLYRDKEFRVSKKQGTEQYDLGKKRIIEWFKVFEEYGLAEWNSTTYIPIDLIGFISLYELAPDEEIKMLAKNALDKIIKIIAINFHGDQMASSYGRCYEKELKAMEFGELSFITWMMWGKGYVNSTSRSTALMAITKYPLPDVSNYLQVPENGVVYEYKQGIKGVDVYLYKHPRYTMGSVLNYEPGYKGHQQHTFNISLGQKNTQLWINHPGELVPSGENRPSYWAGNGIMPHIEQYENNAILNYNLVNSEIKFVHLYVPHWNLDSVDVNNNTVYLKKDNLIVSFKTNADVTYTKSGANAFKEIIFSGEQIIIATNISIEKAPNIEIDGEDVFIDNIKYTVTNKEFRIEEKKVVRNIKYLK